MNILKQSTAATIKLGPFVDDTDGKTAETALTIGQADIRLSKNGGDIAQSHNTAGATHDELGYYDIPLDTTDTGTLGRLRVLVSKAGALPVWQDFLVVTANVFDTFCSTGSLNVNAASLSTDAITAASVKAEAVTKIQNGLATPTNITAGTITTVTNLTNLPTMPTDWVTAAGLKADAVTEIQSGLATAAALDAVDNFVDTEVAAILAAVDTEVAAIKAKTDNLPASPAAVGSAMTLTAAYDKAKDDVLTPLGVVDGIVDAIKVQTDKIPATPASAGEYTTNIGAIKAKTDNLPLSPASSGEYTSALTAIQNDLDNPNQYKADVSNLALEATLTAIKGAGWSTETLEFIGGKGTNIVQLLTEDGVIVHPGMGFATTTHLQEVEDKVDSILEDTGTTLDTLIKDIPTNAEITTALGTADDAVLAAVAAAKSVIDNIHDTDLPAIKAETASILEDTSTTLDTLIKDIPTNAELATALGTADDAVLAAVAAAKVVIDDIHDTDLPAVKAETALIVEDTGTTLPAVLEAIDNFIDTEVAAILEDTGTTIPATLATIAGDTDGIAGDVWSHPHRTLTNQGIDATSPASGDPLIIYRDSTVGISLTGLADSTNSTKMWFTVKENLEDADTSSILQILFTNAETHTDTLLYVNKAAPISADNGGFVVADHTDGTASITLAAAEAANLPIYAATPLYWDVKMLTAAGVTILSTGTMYIYGTPTRTIS